MYTSGQIWRKAQGARRKGSSLQQRIVGSCSRCPVWCLSLGLILLSGCANPGSSDDSVAVTDSESVLELKLGVVRPDSKVVRELVLKNDSTTSWQVDKTSRDCACLVESIEPSFIEPGADARVQVAYTAPSSHGRVEHRLTIGLTGRLPPAVQIRVTGIARRDLHASPVSLDFGELIAGEPKQVSFRLLDYRAATDGAAWFDTSATHPWVRQQYTTEKTVLDQFGERVHQRLVQLEVTAPHDLPESSLRGEITYTDPWSDEPIILTIPYVAKLRAPWVADVSRLFFGVMRPGATSTKQLTIRGTSSLPDSVEMNVNSPNSDYLELSQNAADQHRTIAIIATMHAPETPVVIEAELQVSGSGFPTLRIPVMAMVATESPE